MGSVLREGWEVKKLIDVCLVQRGSSPRPIKKYITDTEDGVNWIKIGDTKNVDKYIYTTNQKITKEGAEKSRYVKEGDFILSNSMSFGKPYIMKTDGYIHDGWFVLRLHDFIDTEYFFQLLSSPYVNEQFHKLASGSVVKNISGDLVKKVILPIPPLPEQQKIVAILDEAFSAIEKAKANAELNLKNAKELFESYLQGVFENKDEGWEEKKLGHVCAMVKRGISPKYIENNGYIVLNQKCIRDHKICFEKSRLHDNITKRVNPERIIKLGDVLINSTGTGTLGRVAQVKDNFKNVIVDSHITIVRPLTDLFFINFFGWALIYIEDKITNSGEGCGGQTELARDKLENDFKICFPNSKTDQKTIVKKLDTLSEQTKKLEKIYEQKIKDLEELKKSILQKAFNGELT